MGNHETICFSLKYTINRKLFSVDHGKMEWFDAAKTKACIYFSVRTSLRNSSDLFISRFPVLAFSASSDAWKGLTILRYGRSVHRGGFFAADGLHSIRGKKRKRPLVIS